MQCGQIGVTVKILHMVCHRSEIIMRVI